MYKELFLFTLVGIFAFVVDVTVLYWIKNEIGVYWGRAAAFFCAVLVTWILNRSFTFKKNISNLSLLSEFAQYLSLMLGGGIINYFTYVLLVSMFDIMAKQPIWAVAIGSITGMLINFTLARFFVFTSPRRSRHQDIDTP